LYGAPVGKVPGIQCPFPQSRQLTLAAMGAIAI
jgi:hypothetical protein